MLRNPLRLNLRLLQKVQLQLTSTVIESTDIARPTRRSKRRRHTEKATFKSRLIRCPARRKASFHRGELATCTPVLKASAYVTLYPLLSVSQLDLAQSPTPRFL